MHRVVFCIGLWWRVECIHRNDTSLDGVDDDDDVADNDGAGMLWLLFYCMNEKAEDTRVYPLNLISTMRFIK